MCGIVGAVAQRNITPVLIEGLKRLEYRGYDSCGVALHVEVDELEAPYDGGLGPVPQPIPALADHWDDLVTA